MNTEIYLSQFQQVADKLNKTLLQDKHIEVAVGIVLNSVFLKLYKKSWTSSVQDRLNAESRIFFSIWINESTIRDQKIFYNIHALKLRKLKGYSIQSRKFAELFRKRFNAFKHKWPNVSTDFGPLTLMEGWINIDSNNLTADILQLANNFLEIDHLVDEALINFR